MSKRPTRLSPEDKQRHQDRDRGAISPSDREFLFTGGEKLKTPQVRSKTRRRVLDRVRDSIIDFAILDEYIDDRDIEDIFEPRDDWTDEAFRSGVEAMIAFLYRGAQRTNDDELDFDQALTAGVHAAVQSQYEQPVLVNVHFDVDEAEEVDTDEALKKYENGRRLSTNEIGVLLATGAIGPEDAADLANYARSNTDFQALGLLASDGVNFPTSYRERDEDNAETDESGED